MTIHKGTVAMVPATKEDLDFLLSEGKNLEQGEIWIDHKQKTMFAINPTDGTSYTISTANTAIETHKHNLVIDNQTSTADFKELVDLIPNNDFSMIIHNIAVLKEDIHFRWEKNGGNWTAVRIDGGVFDPGDELTVVVIRTFLTAGDTIGASLVYLDNIVSYTDTEITEVDIPESYEQNRDSIEIVIPGKIIASDDYTINTDTKKITFKNFSLNGSGQKLNIRVWKMVRNALLPSINGETILKETIKMDRMEEIAARELSGNRKINYVDYNTLKTTRLDGEAATINYLRSEDSTIYMKIENSSVNPTKTLKTRTLYDKAEQQIIKEQKTFNYNSDGKVTSESEWVEIS